MAKYQLRQRVFDLRNAGLSYSQIKEKIPVSKSTLSIWLKDLPLSRERINELRAHSERRIEKFRETWRRKRERNFEKIYRVEAKTIGRLSRRELYLLGLFLYWGEGSKTMRSTVSLSNTNPLVCKFFVYWLQKVCGVPRKSIIIRLHCYTDSDIAAEKKFWLKQLDLPETSFRKPYIKDSSRYALTHRSFGHGTCNIIVYDTNLFEKIMAGIKAITDNTLSPRV